MLGRRGSDLEVAAVGRSSTRFSDGALGCSNAAQFAAVNASKARTESERERVRENRESESLFFLEDLHRFDSEMKSYIIG